MRSRIGLALVTGLCLGCAPEGGERIVLVTVDTLRYDSFTKPNHMPRTRELARSGLVFERHYAASTSTQPTHASILTGLHPWQHGVPRNGYVLSDRQVTLAERLSEAGFATGAVVSSVPVRGTFGYEQGFDEFEDDFKETLLDEWNARPIEGNLFYTMGADVTDAAIDMIERTRGSRQFYWFHYFDPHDPYGDTTGEQRIEQDQVLNILAEGDWRVEPALKAARQAYNLDVRYLDRELHRLFRHLLDDTRYETHIVLTADHGESFGEHGSVGHGKRLTEEQIRVPLVLHSPHVRPGVRGEPCGSVDVFTTILGLAGIDGSGTGGRDLARDEGGVPALGMRRTFAEPYEDTRTDGVHIVEGYYFYLAESEHVWRGNSASVTRDYAEAEDADRGERIRRLFESFEESLEGVDTLEKTDAETQAALEALGYVR